MNWIKDLLAVIGVISLIITVIRVIWVMFVTNIEWVESMRVKKIPIKTEGGNIVDDSFMRTDSGEWIFPIIHVIDESEYSHFFLFRPNKTIIKKMKLYELDYKKGQMKPKKKLIKKFKNISPFRPLVIQVSLREFIPYHCVCWKEKYGLKMRYDIHECGVAYDVENYGMSCKIGLFSRIRRVIGLM